MSFSEILRYKIEARQTRASVVRTAAEALQEQALDRIRHVHVAVLEMVGRLAEDPIFAAGFGPAPDFAWSPDAFGGFGSFKIFGPAGIIVVQVSEDEPTPWQQAKTGLALTICPASGLDKALGCGLKYAEATPVKGTIADVPGFIVAAEDMLAEFLADVAVSPVASKFLPGFRPTAER